MRPGRLALGQLLVSATLLSAALTLPVARAWALTYPPTPEEARTQYLQLYQTLRAQGPPAPELLAAVDPSLRGKVFELTGKLQSSMCWRTPQGESRYIFLLQTDGAVAVALSCNEALEGVCLNDPVRVLASLPTTSDSTEFCLYGLVRQADLATAPPATPAVAVAAVPVPLPAPTAKPPLASSERPSPTVARSAVWDGVPGGPNGAPQTALPDVGIPQAGLNRWKAWVAKHNSDLSDLQLELTVRWVIIYSALAGIDHHLSFAMIRAESDFHPMCLSHAGAMGMTQLMPCNLDDMKVSNPWNVQQNLRGGIQLLSDELHKFADRPNYEQCILGLAAYNAGPNAVKKYGGVPPYQETQTYVKRVSQQFYDLVTAGYP